jgi:hypothetical protein
MEARDREVPTSAASQLGRQPTRWANGETGFVLTSSPCEQKGRAMRRRILVLVGLAMLLVPVAPVAADTTGGGGTSFHFSQTGSGADAGWSTAPADGQLVAGVVYTDTFISASQQAVKLDGTVFSDKFLFIDQFSYKIDKSFNFIAVSETFGFAGGTDVNLSVNAKLTSASVAASVALQTCTVDRRGNFTCADGGIGSVSASWTGQGDLIRQSGSFHVVSKGFTENFTSRQTSRNAVAKASLNGAGIGGQPFFADIFSATSKDIFICHGPGSC